MDFSKIHPFQLIVLGGFAAVALIGIILFSLCGGANSTCGSGGHKVHVGTVVIWGTLPQSAMDTAVNGLKQKDQQYAAVSYVQKPAATFENDVTEALASGTGPDMIVLSQEDLLSEENKLQVIPFSSLPQRQFVDSYLPIYQLFLTDKGTYGVPLVVDPLVLYYNRSILASAGVATPPTTWEAVLGLAPLVVHKDGQGNVSRALIGFGGYGNVPNARALLSLLFLQAGNPVSNAVSGQLHSALANVSTQNSLGVVPAEAALSYYAQFADPSKTVYTWNNSLPDARQFFISENSALYPGFASEVGLLKAGNPNLNFDMAPIPQPQNIAERVTYAHAYAFALPKQSRNPSGAFTVAYMLAGKDFSTALAQSLSMAPALRTALTAPASDLYAPLFYPEALVARGWLSPSPQTVDGIFGTMIGNISSGHKSAHDALFQADQALDAALQSP